MSVTEETTTTMNVTVNAARLLEALQNVALFASADTTLPSLRCIRLTAADGTLTAEATDRYVLARHTVPGADGAGDMLADAKETLAAVKPMIAILKDSRRLLCRAEAEQPVITITCDSGYVWYTMTGHDAPTLTGTARAGDPRLYPRTGSHDTDAPRETADRTFTFTAANLAKLAKVSDGHGTTRANLRYVRITPGGTGRPAAVHVGEHFSALVMTIKIRG